MVDVKHQGVGAFYQDIVLPLLGGSGGAIC